ncbi:MAG: Gfo/Idh/MocA family oxidoreductase [Spirochaetia bacterium]|jgi:predicted dehydrogenase
MGISIGLVGLGAFGSEFAPLFKSHPLVDRIALCDREPDRIARFARDPSFTAKLRPSDTFTSLDEICRARLDAVVLITQPWLHAPQAIQAMESGKHVYSAVPIISLPDADEILEWCDRVVRTCARTGMRYMLGETTYFRPQAMFCRRMAGARAFGDFTYAEGEYFHPYDWKVVDLREVKAQRLASASGREWSEVQKRYDERGIRMTPMTYPTHSTSGPISVMKAHALKASAFGYTTKCPDPYFDNHEFTNVTALFQMSNGAQMRVCEHRELAYPESDLFQMEIFRLFGTKGTFRENRWADKESWRTLTVEEMRDPLPSDVANAFRAEYGESKMYGGHGGSHAYLVHEFVDAVAHGRQPAINAWEAARYMAAGVAAHRSALREGEVQHVADWGDAPA